VLRITLPVAVGTGRTKRWQREKSINGKGMKKAAQKQRDAISREVGGDHVRSGEEQRGSTIKEGF
jgi:hypothetical protein